MARKISEVMTRDVETLRPTDTVRDASESMRSLNVGVLPVCEGERVVGVLTDRDLIVRAIALGMEPSITQVSDVMTSNVQVCFEDDDVGSVLERMKKQQLRRFVVVDRDEALVGIVSIGDLSQDFDEERVGEALEGISEPAPPRE
ncbi:CBS domain-containing protein [Melittangium boletus]|uniref:CBS domain-containing protein n=1 Tax=Melittangium boletus DSM 14713 TaxID=1294270 RepID=A0A250ID84_9BACT|nr:CBS domain-containing protein [Melittangium boletus]ATB29824.1 CBS domain-containing protein [Melittangium boletus DSM 14713]